MPHRTFVSHAQNREDVVLHRVLRSVAGGHYVEVGANEPTLTSISRGFYDLGWSGLTIDPVREFVLAHRRERPRDTMIEAAITDADGDEVVLHQIAGSGLSTLDDAIAKGHHAAGWETEDVHVPARRLDEVLDANGWQGKPIHFMIVDVEGLEESVLRSIDLTLWRPWIVVVEATRPLSTEPAHLDWEPILLSADYEFRLFDGVSRFYLAKEHDAELGAALSYPACARDDFEYPLTVELAELWTATEQLARTLDQTAAEVAMASGPLADELQAAISARDQALNSAGSWRARALEAWGSALDIEIPTVSGAPPQEVQFLRETNHHLTMEMQALQQTLSWRVTRPLRGVRRLMALRGRS